MFRLVEPVNFEYFEIWSEEVEGKESILDQALKKMVGKVRTSNGRKEKTSFCIGFVRK